MQLTTTIKHLKSLATNKRDPLAFLARSLETGEAERWQLNRAVKILSALGSAEADLLIDELYRLRKSGRITENLAGPYRRGSEVCT